MLKRNWGNLLIIGTVGIWQRFYLFSRMGSKGWLSVKIGINALCSFEDYRSVPAPLPVV
jgi:hypothetical protein